jgi:hypothetical protein
VPEWVKNNVPAVLALATSALAILVGAVKWLVFRLVEFPINELKAELSLERQERATEAASKDRKIEVLEGELKATSKELYLSLKTCDAQAKKLGRARGSSSSAPPSSS